MKSELKKILKYSTRIIENENRTDFIIDNIDEVINEILSLFNNTTSKKSVCNGCIYDFCCSDENKDIKRCNLYEIETKQKIIQ